MRTVARGLVTAVALLGVVGRFGARDVRADIGPNIDVKTMNLFAPARPGVPMAFDIHVGAASAETLRSVSLDPGRSRDVTTNLPPVGAGPPVIVRPGSPLVVHVQATPLADDVVMRLDFSLSGGRRVQHTVDLSRATYDLLRRTIPAAVVPPDAPLEPEPLNVPAALLALQPAPVAVAQRHDGERPVRDARVRPGTAAAGSHTVHVLAKFRYKRYDNMLCSTDGATVRVYDEDWDFDELLYEGTLGPSGNLDVHVVCGEDEPDLYVEIESGNSHVEVQEATWGYNYVMRSAVAEDFTGSTKNFGTFAVTGKYGPPAFHMCRNITRAWRWFKNTTGINVDNINFDWPSSSWPAHHGWSDTIVIPEYFNGGVIPWPRWATDTHVHEWGHHIMDEHMYQPDYTYDNAWCDKADGTEGHCSWCEEDGGVAVNEGWPNWLADVVMRSLETDYGQVEDDDYKRDYETTTSDCVQGGGMPCDCDPYKTEGYFAALLRDLEDDTPGEDDPNTGSDATDETAMGPAAMVQIMQSADIDSPNEFLSRVLVEFPGLNRSKYWRSCRNAGYMLTDNTTPSTPTGLASADHAVNVPSADATIHLTWNAATDNLSGVEQYRVQMSSNGGSTWTATWDVAGDLFLKTGELNPGSYLFRIRAQDYAGNLGTYSPAAGPFVVRDPYPADFTSTVLPGWTSHLVPRNTTGATTTNCALTATLPGNSANTYWNFSGKNVGELANTANVRTRFLLDGVPLDSVNHGFINPGGTFQSRNNGPFTVRGGRHTLEAWYDAAEINAEPSETNNRKGQQYVWTPLSLTFAGRVHRAAPPIARGGWESFTVPFLSPKWFNVDGLSYSHGTLPFGSTVPWRVTWACATQNATNYDLMLHLHSDGSEDGFTNGLATSNRAAGLLDATITNLRTQPASSTWDVGVVNDVKGTSSYLAQAVGSSAIAIGDSVTIALPESSMVAVRDLFVPAGSAAKIAVEVRLLSGSGPVYSLWLANDYTYGTISTYDGKVGTNAAGVSLLTLSPAASTYHGLVFYRNPSSGFGPLTFTVKVFAKPADPAPTRPIGWYAAITPRAANDGTATSVPAPAVLPGDGPLTYLNWAWINGSDVTALNTRVHVSIDRTLYGNFTYPSVGAFTQAKSNNQVFLNGPAGRRMLKMQVDPLGVQSELSETNNVYAEQWVWSPGVSALGAPLWRKGTNGSATEGWSVASAVEPLELNCDGLRSPDFTPASAAGWAGFAITPRAGSDLDLRLHEKADSSKSGFEAVLESSGWPEGLTDFVLVNFAATSYRGFDAGVVRASDDTSSYLANVVAATLRSPAAGVHGPFVMGAGRVLELHAVDLAPGPYGVQLLQQGGGAVDWGLAVFSPERPYQNRTAGLDLGAAWEAAGGQNEAITFHAPEAGRYVIAAWKNGSADVGLSGSYSLAINANVTGVEPGAVGETRLMAARPNPFRPGTSLAFTLSRAGHVTIDVHDVRGARVRTLAQGAFAAGSHEARWDGRDEAGRAVAEGIYLVRMVGPGYTGSTKLVKMK